ncbi:MAG: Hpt domain-containing protein [Gammaproteobacteria bacterium]|nr:Hpt domain-containing protein [Gammaproteobacteria bacterium]
MNEAIDYSTVKWVKQELDATLKQARQALEAYVENPGDESQLRFCAVHLHQVHGTLQMVELYGAALLAEEMEQVVEALLADGVGQKQEAYELVMRGALQLPDYLERLIAGGRDLPLVLLPLLNDLRAIRGQKLLSENALFSPDLSLPLPLAARRDNRGEDLPTAVRKQRHGYQVALLGWFRNKDVATNLQRLGDALDAIQAACAQEATQRLWWVAGGMIAALREGWLETSMATRLLLGQVDRQIKRIIDEGEAALLPNPPADLLKNLLFYVARAKDGGEPVSLIKATYKLGALLPDSEELERAQQSLTGHNAELMQTVSLAIKEDLTRVKDALDLFLRGGRKAVTDLQPAADTLSRIADTLGMLGLGALRKVAQEQAQATVDMVAGRREAEEIGLMDIASALLYVESALEGLVQGGAPEPEAPAAAEQPGTLALPEAEFNQVRGVVADEALRDIVQTKDAILAFMENTADFSVLEKVPQLFHQIKGSLLLLNEQRAADLVDAVRGYVAERMLSERQLPVASALDDLADAISSVEYYLENLREGRLFGHTVLEVAEKSLARLSQAVTQPAAENGAPTVVAEEPAYDYRAEALGMEDTDFAVDDAAFGVTEAATEAGIEAGAADATSELSATLDAFTVEEDAFETLASEADENIELVEAMDAFAVAEDVFTLSEETLPEGMADAAPEVTAVAAPVVELQPIESAPPVAAAPTHNVLAEDIDEEILEIFLEEADEEFANISDCLPRWLADEQDKDALTTMRRSFHTLKGSGRLVGALRLGEFAWGFESLLNRVLDGALPRNETVCGLLERALPALPELIAQIRSGAATTQPVEALMNMAHALSRGEPVTLGCLDIAAEAAVAAASPEIAVAELDIAQFSADRHEVDPFAMEAHAQDEFTAYEIEHEITSEGVSEFGGGIDPVLYDIFSAESYDHIATIRGYLACCRAQGAECRITDDLMRALHTLHGSARMAGAEIIAEIAYEIEKYAKALRNDQLPMCNDGMDLTEQAMQVVEALLVELNAPEGVQTPYAELVEAIAALPRATQNVAHIPSAEVPSEQDDIEPTAEMPAEFQPVAEVLDQFAPIEATLGTLEWPAVSEVAADAMDAFAEPELGPELEPELKWESIDPFDTALTGEYAEPMDFAVAEDSDPFAAFMDEIPEEVSTEVQIEVPIEVRAEMTDVVEAEAVADSSVAPEMSEPMSAPMPEVAAQNVAPTVVPAVVAEGEWVTFDYRDADADLLEVFLEEGDEILGAIDTTLQHWMGAAEDNAPMAELQRHLHTLKGGARMANIGAIGDLSHALESLLIAVVDGQVAPSQTLFDLLLVAQDRLVHMLEAVRAQRPMRSATGIIDQLEALRHGQPLPESVAAVTPMPAPVETSAAPRPATVEEVDAIAVGEDMQKFTGRVQQELVRVRADLLDNMVNFAGEISIYRSRMEQQVGSMRFNLSELGQTVVRLRDQLRQVEIETEAQVLFRYEREGTGSEEQFDPLEMDRYSHLQQLSRSMLESIGDLVSIQGLLDNVTRESETLLLQQSRVNTELQEGLMRTRMVPFSGLAPRMRRIVRQACQELGKRAELSLEGAEGEMDRTVIDRIIAPLEHMLRNAIAHGIEMPEQRRAAGKRESGNLKVSLMRDGSEVVIKMADDGAGINIAAIRRKAKERGMIVDDAEISDHDVMQFILETGFSTAEQV